MNLHIQALHDLTLTPSMKTAIEKAFNHIAVAENFVDRADVTIEQQKAFFHVSVKLALAKRPSMYFHDEGKTFHETLHKVFAKAHDKILKEKEKLHSHHNVRIDKHGDMSEILQSDIPLSEEE